jgi:hypothetical protein
MGGLGKVLLSLAIVFAWLTPVVLAKLFADTLDFTPYILCLLVGLGLGALACVLAWPLVRSGLTHSGRSPGLGLAVAMAIAFAPTWSIGIGLGLNRVFDRSASVSHVCQVIDWKVPLKNRSYCVVSSWRGNKTEKLDHSLIQNSEPGQLPPHTSPDAIGPRGWPYPFKCTPGTAVDVTTRAGLLGWPWVVGVERKR